jgi:alpha-ribazole phosphatase
MKLWLFRHAQVLVESGLCYGVSDVAFSHVKTREAAEKFSKYPSQGCALWSSPSERAFYLATSLKKIRPDLKNPMLDVRLREMNFGKWEMHPWNDVPKAEYDAWIADYPNYRFGGQESAQEVIDRVSDAINHALSSHEDELIWITHAGVIRAVQFLVDSYPRQSISNVGEWPLTAPKMGEWVGLNIF